MGGSPMIYDQPLCPSLYVYTLKTWVTTQAGGWYGGAPEGPE